MRSACEVGRPEFRVEDLRPRLTRDLIREFVRLFPRVSTYPPLPVRDASTWEGGTVNPEATYDIHILGGVCPRGERERRGKAAGEGRRHRGGVGRGRVWQRLVAGGGWQSVEGSGADQWHDGGNPGILTL